LVLLLITALPLSAQVQDGIIIYVSPITGTGSAPEDNELFVELITNELMAWNFSVTAESGEEEYFLVGALAPSESAENRFFFSLALQNKDGATLQEQGLNYTTMDEASTLVPTLLFNIFSNVFDLNTYRPPEEPEPVVEDPWRRQEWYLGANVFWNPRSYYGDRLAINNTNLAFALSAEYHFLRFAAGNLFWLKYISAETGLEFTGEYIAASTRAGDEYNNVILQIPLFLHYVWRPGVSYMHEPYAGIIFNIPFFPDTTPALLSWAIGFKFGMKAGPGIAYANIRYAMDCMPSGLHKDNPNDTRQYQRYMLYFGIGYKYNLVEHIINAITGNNEQLTGNNEQLIMSEEELTEPEEAVAESEEEVIEVEEAAPEVEEAATEPEEEIAEIEETITEDEEEVTINSEQLTISEEEATELEEEVTSNSEQVTMSEEEATELEEEVTSNSEQVTMSEEETTEPEVLTESDDDITEPGDIIESDEGLPQPETLTEGDGGITEPENVTEAEEE